MVSFVTGAIGFILGFSLLIAFHEFGHYYVARLANVKILKFSIGFGKPLCRRVAGADRTEYVIASIPLGGYVSMLGQDERGLERVAEEDRARAFCRQPLWIRALIVAAGPAANFLLAVVLFAGAHMIGSYEIKPIIGSVQPHSIAARAGLRANDEFVRVGGDEVSNWKALKRALLRAVLDDSTVEVEALRDGNLRVSRLEFDDSGAFLSNQEPVLRGIGIAPLRYEIPAVIGELTASGSAYGSGLRERDKVVFADGREIAAWQSFVELIRQKPNQSIPITVQRGGESVDLRLQIGATEAGGQTAGRIGASPYVSEDTRRSYARFVNYSWPQAVRKGLADTADLTRMTLLYIARMATGDVSLKNISGPVTIAEITGTTFNIGMTTYLFTLALLSISIGILNLLPIPLLDGGHLLYYLIEFIKRSPLSHSAQIVGYGIGVVMIGSLLILALYNDLTRLLH